MQRVYSRGAGSVRPTRRVHSRRPGSAPYRRGVGAIFAQLAEREPCRLRLEIDQHATSRREEHGGGESSEARCTQAPQPGESETSVA